MASPRSKGICFRSTYQTRLLGCVPLLTLMSRYLGRTCYMFSSRSANRRLICITLYCCEQMMLRKREGLGWESAATSALLQGLLQASYLCS